MAQLRVWSIPRMNIDRKMIYIYTLLIYNITNKEIKWVKEWLSGIGTTKQTQMHKYTCIEELTKANELKGHFLFFIVLVVVDETAVVKG